MATVLDVLAAIQAVNLSISGIQTAPTLPPDTLAGVLFPAVVAHPRDGNWTSQKSLGARWKAKRTYHVDFYLQPIGEGGASTSALYSLYSAWIEAVGAAYALVGNLGGPPPVGQILRTNAASESLIDSGPLLMQYLSDPTLYYGFTIQVPVAEYA